MSPALHRNTAEAIRRGVRCHAPSARAARITSLCLTQGIAPKRTAPAVTASTAVTLILGPDQFRHLRDDDTDISSLWIRALCFMVFVFSFARDIVNHTDHVDDAEEQGHCRPQPGVSMPHRRVGIIYMLPSGEFGSCPLVTFAATLVGCSSSTCGMEKYRALHETVLPSGNTKNFSEGPNHFYIEPILY